MSTPRESSNYRDLVTIADRHAWDELSPEQRKQYPGAVDYVRDEYPDEELSVALIGTAMAFGG